MKKNIIIGFISMLSICLISCKKFLATEPYDKITGNQTWSSENLTTAYIYQVYADVFGTDAWIAGYAHPNSARSEGITKNVMVGTLNGAFWSADRAEQITKTSNYGWLSYSLLWRINTAISKVDESPKFSENFKKRALGELYFLRAAHYFVYAKMYGGLQIIDHELTLNDNLQIPRSTAKETYDFIITDLDRAAISLPETAERGRASNKAAHSLLMRVALQAASYVDGGAANSIYYDKVIISGTALGLNADGSQLSPYYNMFRRYETAIASSEFILTRERNKTNSSLYETPMQYQGLWANGRFSAYAKEHFPIPVTMNFWGMDGGGWPTQDLVDDYLVTDQDGTIKFWGDASYVTTGKTVDEKMYYSETKRRDQRFYATILYDSSMYFKTRYGFSSGGMGM